MSEVLPLRNLTEKYNGKEDKIKPNIITKSPIIAAVKKTMRSKKQREYLKLIKKV